MDYERALISKAAQTGRVASLLSEGISEEHFEDEQNQEIWKYMVDHARRYKQSPSFQTVRTKFSEYNFELSDEALDFIKDEFMKLVRRRKAIDALRDLAEAIDDPDRVGKIDELFLEQSRRLSQVVPSVSVSRFSDIEKRIAAYEASDGADVGIRMGIDAIDNITLGIQPHEYVTISGWSGTGKSTLAQWILFNAWMQKKTPMYISLEMEANALFRKWDTMLTHFNYHRLKAHELREEEIEKWKESAEIVKQRIPNDIIVMDDVKGCTVDRVYAELVRWKPDIVCIDYLTLMDVQRSVGNSMWEKLTYLTQSLKQVSRVLKIPIIGVAQTNRASAQGGAQLDNIAYSVSIIQDSDIVLGLHQDDDMKDNKQMQLKMLKNRDGMQNETLLRWEMDTMTFDQWRESHRFMSHA